MNEDKLIRELQEKVFKQEAEINKIQSYINKTNMSFPMMDSARSRVNLNTVNDLSELIDISAKLIMYRDYVIKAGEEIGAKSIVEWGGFSYDDWIHDIRNRVKVISIRKRKDELKKIKERLSNLLSPEAKRKLEIDEIKNRLED